MEPKEISAIVPAEIVEQMREICRQVGLSENDFVAQGIELCVMMYHKDIAIVLKEAALEFEPVEEEVADIQTCPPMSPPEEVHVRHLRLLPGGKS